VKIASYHINNLEELTTITYHGLTIKEPFYVAYYLTSYST